MNRKLRFFLRQAVSLLTAGVLLFGSTALVAADDMEDSDPVIETLAGEGYSEENSGIIEENEGSLDINSGTINDNTGFVDENQGTVVDNNGWINSNAGTVEVNNSDISINEEEGTVGQNTGDIYENYGDITNNEGEVWDNYGSISLNDGSVHDNHGTVKDNQATVYNGSEGTVEVNNGIVENGSVMVLPGFFIEFETGGVVELNNGIVMNAGIVKTNKGKVFNYGGTIENDEGEEYYRIWLSTPGLPIDDVMTYTVDSGFVSFDDFDRWLEKNDTGELTVFLRAGYRFNMGIQHSGTVGHYKGQLLNDRTMKITFDELYKWLDHCTLLLPVERVWVSAAPKVTVSEYTVSFDLDGGAFNAGTPEEETGIVERKYSYGEEIVFSEIPEKEGYTFLCWEEQVPEEELEKDGYDPEDYRYKEGDSYTVEGDITFKAIWEEKENG